MASLSQEREIEILIRARYPLIYLVSWEERRVGLMLERLARARAKRLFFWSVTRGFVDAEKAIDGGVRDPLGAIDYLTRGDDHAIYVLKDFHPYLKDPAVVRRLRDLAQWVKSTYKTVILLAPVLSLPVELEKDVTVIDYDLPGADELRALLREAIVASRAGSRFKIDLAPADEERLVEAARGMTLSEAENAFAKAIVIDNALKASDVDVILEEKKQIIRKSHLLEYIEAREQLGQVGGLQTLKEWLRKRGRAFWEEARQFGLPQPRGLLLLGVQGCGKSLVCKAIASAWKMPLLRLDMGTIFGGFVGQSEENMRRAIKIAEAVAPCVLWLDEIEKALAGTQSSGLSDSGTTARVFSTFLTWLQEKTQPVFVAATANDIRALPPELLRKGRLDEIFFVDLPSEAERGEIFAIHLKAKGRDPDAFDPPALARLTAGFSGAEIEQVVIEGLYEAFDRGRELTMGDLERAAGDTVPLSRTMAEEIDRLRQWATVRARPASPPEPGPASPAPAGRTWP